MPDTMSHEEMRFDTMTLKQLFTRLQKITHRQKLENFIYMAEKRRYYILAQTARNKFTKLFPHESIQAPSYGYVSGISSSMGVSGSDGPIETSGTLGKHVFKKEKKSTKPVEKKKDEVYTKRKLRFD